MYQLTVNSVVRLAMRTIAVAGVAARRVAWSCFISISLPACSLIISWGTGVGLAQDDLACVEIARQLPPLGLEVPQARQTEWIDKIGTFNRQLELSDSPHEADIAVLLKACEFAIEHQEFYRDRDFDKADRLLELAQQRLKEIDSGNPTWLSRTGRQVRGFRSKVDGSVQPIGLVFSKNIADASGSVPLYVWLHGRGDQVTDLHFISERLDKDGQITPAGAIVLHPFGRQCVGYKSAGETDVMEAIDFVCEHYPIDEQRIVLMGFSMGGAGVWHLAAHYGQRFVAASPGAGFAETARYQRLTPDRFPPKYEQLLWSVYDVPGYTRNLFNLPVVAYSGENDKQIQAAQVMEEAFRAEGRELTHLIGPGMEHKYHPDTLAEILARMSQAVKTGMPSSPSQLYIQSPHPRYAKRGWITIDGAQEQYSDTRVDASWTDSGWNLATKNVSRLILSCTEPTTVGSDKFEIDRQTMPLLLARENLLTRNSDGKWQEVESFPQMRKRPGISGPIDDAFIDPFLVVLPSEAKGDSRVDQWVACELRHFQARWKSVFRGQPRSKPASAVTDQDLQKFHLVLWGTPQTNPLIARLLTGQDGIRLPIIWSSERIIVGDERFGADSHVPLLIYPNPLNPEKYVVVNSGPTFREAHDRTNSLQNPHLPDWAIISLDELPSAQRPGAIRRAGFFDSGWQLDQKLRW